MMTIREPRKHPSGSPIRNDSEKRIGFTRIPNDEPLTPRLRPGRERTTAIGFGLEHRDEDADS